MQLGELKMEMNYSRVNGNGKIVVPAEIVAKMGGKPGDEVVFVEYLTPKSLVVMLKSVYEMKDTKEDEPVKEESTIFGAVEEEPIGFRYRKNKNDERT